MNKRLINVILLFVIFICSCQTDYRRKSNDFELSNYSNVYISLNRDSSFELILKKSGVEMGAGYWKGGTNPGDTIVIRLKLEDVLYLRYKVQNGKIILIDTIRNINDSSFYFGGRTLKRIDQDYKYVDILTPDYLKIVQIDSGKFRLISDQGSKIYYDTIIEGDTQCYINDDFEDFKSDSMINEDGVFEITEEKHREFYCYYVKEGKLNLIDISNRFWLKE